MESGEGDAALPFSVRTAVLVLGFSSGGASKKIKNHAKTEECFENWRAWNTTS